MYKIFHQSDAFLCGGGCDEFSLKNNLERALDAFRALLSDEVMEMLRPKAAKRGEDLPSFTPHLTYSRVQLEPQDHDVRGTVPRDRWQKLTSTLGKITAILALSAPVIFVFTWNHLFTIDMGARAAMARMVDSPLDKTFTVRMNTYRRNDLLKRSAEHFARCDCVGEIQVVWSDQENSPPSLDVFSEESRTKIRFEVHDTNSLNHRFNITSPIKTDSVFSVDDDLEISCADLRFGFETWQSSQTMVGFSPRMVTRDPVKDKFSYRSWRVVRWNGFYNVILTKCCFLHQRHLRTYAEKMPQALLSYIDRHRNCEDIAMSMLVAKYFKTPPLWISGKVKEVGGDGISALSHHFDARSECVDFFAQELGGMPLIETSTKVYPVHTGILSWL